MMDTASLSQCVHFRTQYHVLFRTQYHALFLQYLYTCFIFDLCQASWMQHMCWAQYEMVSKIQAILAALSSIILLRRGALRRLKSKCMITDLMNAMEEEYIVYEVQRRSDQLWCGRVTELEKEKRASLLRISTATKIARESGKKKERAKQWGIFCMVHDFYYRFDDPDNNKN